MKTNLELGHCPVCGRYSRKEVFSVYPFGHIEITCPTVDYPYCFRCRLRWMFKWQLICLTILALADLTYKILKDRL